MYSDGSHSISIKASDTKGNIGISNTVSVTVDNIPDEPKKGWGKGGKPK
jgi:hypothetical protein